MRQASVDEYLSRQLIAYIGNKRRLIPRISVAFERILENGAFSAPPRFLDPFCGSGAVSRLARVLGMAVTASDAEPYAAALASAFVARGTAEVEEAFARHGGLDELLRALNAMHPEAGGAATGGEGMLATLYAPADTLRADWRKERLFYTRENALFLDRVRARIDEIEPDDGQDGAARAILLGLLLYEAATHANTSGVFKAFHKGFGGHGKDALKRIMGRAELEYPVIMDGAPARAIVADAEKAARLGSYDVVYLDPPYNQHQYGSNYHLLNAILANDPASQPGLEVDGKGNLKSKAGIAPSWRERKSKWCSRSGAREALRSLMDALDARCIMMSYGDSGVMDPVEVYEELSRRGRVTTEAWPYTAYRGGRQSDGRTNSSSEILFTVTERRGTSIPVPAGELEEALARSRMRACAGRLLVEEARNRMIGGLLPLDGGLSFRCSWPFIDGIVEEGAAADWAASERDALGVVTRSMEEEARVCLVALGEGPERAIRTALERRLLRSLRKLAHPRYREAFEELSEASMGLLAGTSLDELRKLLEQSRRRFDDAPLRSGRSRAP